jgi:hypothetical protein
VEHVPDNWSNVVILVARTWVGREGMSVKEINASEKCIIFLYYIYSSTAVPSVDSACLSLSLANLPLPLALSTSVQLFLASSNTFISSSYSSINLSTSVVNTAAPFGCARTVRTPNKNASKTERLCMVRREWEDISCVWSRWCRYARLKGGKNCRGACGYDSESIELCEMCWDGGSGEHAAHGHTGLLHGLCCSKELAPSIKQSASLVKSCA